MTSLRKARKMKIKVQPKMTAERQKIYRETLETVSKVNRRLKGLKNAGYSGSWASKKLENRLDTKNLKAWSKAGKVKINKSLTNTQLLAIQKASNQFLASETSKARGIEKTREKTIESLKATLAKDETLDNLDAETAYDMLSDDDFNYFNTEEKVGASTLWALLEDSVEYIDGKGESAITRDRNSFVNKVMNMYDSSNDVQARERLMRLYNNYVL